MVAYATARVLGRLGESMPAAVVSLDLLVATLIVSGNANGPPAERESSTAEAGSLPRRLSEGQTFVSFGAWPTRSCEANGAGSIKSLADCSAAAAALGLSDRMAVDDGLHGCKTVDCPSYCYIDKSGKLKFNSAGTNDGPCDRAQVHSCEYHGAFSITTLADCEAAGAATTATEVRRHAQIRRRLAYAAPKR